MLTASAMRWLLGQRATNALAILIFHRVHRVPDPLAPHDTHARLFDRQIRWLKAFGRVIPLEAAVEQLFAGRIRDRAVVITFDDGYADNYDVALPILMSHKVPATFFITSGTLDGGRMWTDTVTECVRRASGPVLDLSAINLGRDMIGSSRARYVAALRISAAIRYLAPERRDDIAAQIMSICRVPLPDDLMLSSNGVRALARAGMSIGAHTVSHPVFTTVSMDRARQEMLESRDTLEAISGQPVRFFAYPNGVPGDDFGSEHAALVRQCGFAGAVAAVGGAAHATDDPFQLPRFSIRNTTAMYCAWLVRNAIVHRRRGVVEHA